MADSNHHEILIDLILKTWKEGLTFDTDAIHFLASSFSITSFDELVMLDDDHCENDRETILDFMTAPDHGFLCRIEPYLMNTDFSVSDEKNLIETLVSMNPTVCLSFAGDSQTVAWPLSTDQIQRFVLKLKLTATIPESIRKAMDKDLKDHEKASVSVFLRHSHIRWTKERETFVCLMIHYCGADSARFQKDFEFALMHLSAPETGKPIDRIFIDTLRTTEKRLGEIETLYEMMKKNTMETLMLQGVNIPAQSSETLRSRIKTLRRILSSVYGWVDASAREHSNVDLGDFEGENGIRKINALFF